MYCSNCGAKVGDSKFCSNCGMEQKRSTQNTNDPFAYQYQKQTEPTSNAALILGVISLFFSGIILGIVAIVLSFRPEAKNATAVRVLGIIGLIGGIISIVLMIVLSATI